MQMHDHQQHPSIVRSVINEKFRFYNACKLWFAKMIGEWSDFAPKNDFLNNENLLVGTRAFAFDRLLLLLLLMNCNCLKLVPHPTTIRRRQITFACENPLKNGTVSQDNILKIRLCFVTGRELLARAVPVAKDKRLRKHVRISQRKLFVSLQMLTAMLDGKESDSHVWTLRRILTLMIAQS